MGFLDIGIRCVSDMTIIGGGMEEAGRRNFFSKYCMANEGLWV